jgi:hypothetical protein
VTEPARCELPDVRGLDASEAAGGLPAVSIPPNGFGFFSSRPWVELHHGLVGAPHLMRIVHEEGDGSLVPSTIQGEAALPRRAYESGSWHHRYAVGDLDVIADAD